MSDGFFTKTNLNDLFTHLQAAGRLTVQVDSIPRIRVEKRRSWRWKSGKLRWKTCSGKHLDTSTFVAEHHKPGHNIAQHTRSSAHRSVTAALKTRRSQHSQEAYRQMKGKTLPPQLTVALMSLLIFLLHTPQPWLTMLLRAIHPRKNCPFPRGDPDPI